MAHYEGKLPDNVSEWCSFAHGCQLGLGLWVICGLVDQSKSLKAIFKNVYLMLAWSSLVVNFTMAIFGALVDMGILGYSYPFLVVVIIFWSLQVQLLLQIIINRASCMCGNPHMANTIKWGTAALVTFLTVVMAVFWVPAHVPGSLLVFYTINQYTDRAVKIILLFLDGGLHGFFIHNTDRRLVRENGMAKYKRLVIDNLWMLAPSLGMDLLILVLVGFKYQVLYTTVQPIAYLVKLRVEISMANVIRRVSSEPTVINFGQMHHGGTNENLVNGAAVWMNDLTPNASSVNVESLA